MSSRRLAAALSVRVLLCALGLLACAAGRAAPAGVYGPLPLERPLHRELLEQAERLTEEFERLGLVITDEPFAGWIEQVGARISPTPTDPYLDYRFFLLRDPTPNAFALANGHVYVHSGTLAWLQNEGQLEALLAHELAHAAGHHALVSTGVATRREIGGSVVSGLLWPISGLYTNLVDVGRSAVTRLSLSSYSRELEREADGWGVELLRAKGRDSTAMLALFERMARAAAGERERGLVLARSHPTFAERVESLRELTGPASAEAAQVDGQFTAFVAPLAVQGVRAYVNANQFQIAVELSTSLTQLLPDDPAVHLAAGDAWRALGPLQGSPSVTLTPKERRRVQHERRRRSRSERYERALRSSDGLINLARHLAEAEARYRRALMLDPTAAEAWRGLGEVYTARSQGRDAAEAFLRYLRLAPDASDAPVVLARALRLAGVAGSTQARSPQGVVILPPMVTTEERRVGADMARPAQALAYEQRAAARTAASLREAGYTVRVVSREDLEADPRLQALSRSAHERFATVRRVLRGRGRRGASRHQLGGSAVRLARALEADVLAFQQVEVTAAGWGQIARAVTLNSLTFLFRDVAGAGRAEVILVDGFDGGVLARHKAVSRVLGRGALEETDVAARLVEGALRDLRGPETYRVEAPPGDVISERDLARLEAVLGAARQDTAATP